MLLIATNNYLYFAHVKVCGQGKNLSNFFWVGKLDIQNLICIQIVEMPMCLIVGAIAGRISMKVGLADKLVRHKCIYAVIDGGKRHIGQEFARTLVDFCDIGVIMRSQEESIDCLALAREA